MVSSEWSSLVLALLTHGACKGSRVRVTPASRSVEVMVGAATNGHGGSIADATATGTTIGARNEYRRTLRRQEGTQHPGLVCHTMETHLAHGAR